MKNLRVAARYGSYNPRRYSKPWIYKIVRWDVGHKPQVEWGKYIGTDDGGEVEIMANVGDIIRHGRKDYRGHNTSADWYVVEDDGTLREIDAAEARRLWELKQQSSSATESVVTNLKDVDTVKLIAELERRGYMVLSTKQSINQ